MLVLQKWFDAKLTWDPKKYGGLRTLHIPSDLIWTPDLVLYNNAAGDPDITILTDALVTHEGHVFWQPPAIYKSFCPIDVTWFPYDSQKCEMKFGTWTYTGRYVDLKQLPKEDVITVRMDGNDVEYMQRGMDLSFFYRSAEWDLLSLSSERHSVLYASCCGPEKYVDITYYFGLRRKTLFFTCNLIIPCFLISILTTFVFYLSDHKITFSISILVTLTVFFLVLIDLMPPTSLVIPMFGRYLITTMILVALSTVVSVVTVNFRFRSGSAHKMSPWIRAVFLNFLPKLHPYTIHNNNKSACQDVQYNDFNLRTEHGGEQIGKFQYMKENTLGQSNSSAHTVAFRKSKKTKRQTDDVIFMNLLRQVRFIAEHFRYNERESEISDDWTFVAMVLDRLFLLIFSILNVGTMFIILEAPSLYDYSEAMNVTFPTKPLGQANLFGSYSRNL
ncbi:putative acetylcholine receptor subunit alpha-type unc-38 [Dictyocaulus viviparus]|uniref:Putative acetylcholine receptor subunit alpha-type unc-38 n=1 Tax=Dictyocaulus viviparus TaxID=29172 RepID=A0A0D8XA00_DICVI|nr:putative acetylcholine receptor subunit alpha-type unc-38 [Dictyocaulus viviparus]